MSKLPVTGARLSTSIKIWYIPSDHLTPDMLLKPTSTTVTNLMPTWIPGVISFEETEDRQSDERRECDAVISGDVVGRIRNTTTKKIRMDRTVLYTGDIIDFFSLAEEIVKHDKTFAILKTEISPQGSEVPRKATLFTGCYIHSAPKSYQLNRDLQIIQSTVIGYSSKFTLTDQSFVV